MKRDKTSKLHLNHHPHRPKCIFSIQQSIASTTCSPSPLAEGPSWWVQKTGRQIESSFSPWAPLRPGLAQKHPCLWILRSLTPSGKWKVERSLAKITLTPLDDPPLLSGLTPKLLSSLYLPRSHPCRRNKDFFSSFLFQLLEIFSMRPCSPFFSPPSQLEQLE